MHSRRMRGTRLLRGREQKLEETKLMFRRWGIVGAKFLATVVALAILVATAGWSYISWNKSKTARLYAMPDGINEVRAVELGGVEQWISLRGRDEANPVLLFVHGGPGSPAMPFIRQHLGALEEHFVVVNWDQRGAGKSYDGSIPVDTMTLDQIVEDCLELTDYLRQQLGAEKIYLAGMSWGSIVGVHAVDRQPEWFHAYIGIGQVVHFVRSEQISYDFTREAARTSGNYQAVTEMREIPRPPYPDDQFIELVSAQRRWLYKLGGVIYDPIDATINQQKTLRTLFFAPEYSILESFNAMRGNAQSVTLLKEDMMEVDFLTQVPSLEVPVFFIQGRHDYVTPGELVEEYYELLDAPEKHLLWFEFSGHTPHLEQPRGFVRIMVERVLGWQPGEN